MKTVNLIFLAAASLHDEVAFFEIFKTGLRVALWGLPILVLIYMSIGEWNLLFTKKAAE